MVGHSVAKLYYAEDRLGDRFPQHGAPALVCQIMLTEVRQTILKVTIRWFWQADHASSGLLHTDRLLFSVVRARITLARIS